MTRPAFTGDVTDRVENAVIASLTCQEQRIAQLCNTAGRCLYQHCINDGFTRDTKLLQTKCHILNTVLFSHYSSDIYKQNKLRTYFLNIL
jgi:hypothetical protein